VKDVARDRKQMRWRHGKPGIVGVIYVPPDKAANNQYCADHSYKKRTHLDWRGQLLQFKQFRFFLN
jgi:hypothetical protein